MYAWGLQEGLRGFGEGLGAGAGLGWVGRSSACARAGKQPAIEECFFEVLNRGHLGYFVAF